MHKPNTVKRLIREYDPVYLREVVRPKELIPKNEQLILPFGEWEETREPRAFGPPGKRRRFC
jgi:hypothetical protein